MTVLSDEALVLVAPFRGYEALAKRRSGRPFVALARRIAVLLFVVGIVGSVTTAGRLVPFHVVAIAAAWSFVPILHGAMVVSTIRFCPRPLAPVRALSLHMAGNGPYLLFFFFLAIVVVASTDVAATFRWLFDTSVLPVLGGATLFGGTVTSYAFYRCCGAASARRAVVLVVAEWFLKVLLCLAWYAAIDNLAPQFLGARTSP